MLSRRLVRGAGPPRFNAVPWVSNFGSRRNRQARRRKHRGLADLAIRGEAKATPSGESRNEIIVATKIKPGSLVRDDAEKVLASPEIRALGPERRRSIAPGATN